MALHADEQTPVMRAPLIGIVAGEASGDQLGAGLMKALKQRWPDARFVGIGGPAMVAAGCEVWYPLERLSVMGLFAVLERLPELLKIRRTLCARMQAEQVDLFIGIDAPDFNLGVAGRLKRVGIKTVHYVSPSVWAWRQGRVRRIRRDIDLMLTLFPFEADFYRRANVPVAFVGHPFADEIDLQVDTLRAKGYWGYGSADRVIAVLPGSRGGELQYMVPLFLDVMERIFKYDNRCRFVVPLANAERREQFETELAQRRTLLPVQLVDGHAREVIAGSDAVLATSGTITLEAMLLGRPTVVAYRWGKVSHAIFSPLVKTPYIALPNILADSELFPEFLQDEATVDNLVCALTKVLNDADLRQQIRSRCLQLHEQLRCNASETAASAIVGLFDDDKFDDDAARAEQTIELCQQS